MPCLDEAVPDSDHITKDIGKVSLLDLAVLGIWDCDGGKTKLLGLLHGIGRWNLHAIGLELFGEKASASLMQKRPHDILGSAPVGSPASISSR